MKGVRSARGFPGRSIVRRVFSARERKKALTPAPARLAWPPQFRPPAPAQPPAARGSLQKAGSARSPRRVADRFGSRWLLRLSRQQAQAIAGREPSRRAGIRRGVFLPSAPRQKRIAIVRLAGASVYNRSLSSGPRRFPRTGLRQLHVGTPSKPKPGVIRRGHQLADAQGGFSPLGQRKWRPLTQ